MMNNLSQQASLMHALLFGLFNYFWTYYYPWRYSGASDSSHVQPAEVAKQSMISKKPLDPIRLSAFTKRLQGALYIHSDEDLRRR